MVIAGVIQIVIASRLLTRDANHPTALAFVAKESSHRRAEIRVELLAAFKVPRQWRVVAKDRLELRCRFDRDGNLQRPRGGEPNERSDIHARQNFRQGRRLSFEAKPRQTSDTRSAHDLLHL